MIYICIFIIFRVDVSVWESHAKDIHTVLPRERVKLWFEKGKTVDDKSPKVVEKNSANKSKSRINTTGLLYLRYLTRREKIRIKGGLLTGPPAAPRQAGTEIVFFHINLMYIIFLNHVISIYYF